MIYIFDIYIGISIDFSVCKSVTKLLCDKFFAILLSIKSPTASTVFLNCSF